MRKIQKHKWNEAVDTTDPLVVLSFNKEVVKVEEELTEVGGQTISFNYT